MSTQKTNRTCRSAHESVRARVAELFAGGKDSLAIGHACGLRQQVVCRILAEQQDVRHALRQREAQHA